MLLSTKMAYQQLTSAQIAQNSMERSLRTHLAVPIYNDRFAKVYGSALTPQIATAVLAMADLGYMWQIADLLDEVREKDLHLQSVLQKRELFVAGSEWEIRPPPGKGKQAQNIANYCRDRLLEIEAEDDLGRSFTDALEDLQGANYMGRCVLEQIWANEGRWWFPKRLEFVHPRRLAYTSDWRMHLWDASGTNTSMYLGPNGMEFSRPFGEDYGENSPFGQFPGVPLASFPAGKFIRHTPRVRGVYPTREGLGRAVLFFCIFKRFDIRDYLAYVEWAGRGMRFATFATGADPNNPARATDDDIKATKAALDQLSSSISAVFPDTSKPTITTSPSDNNVHERMAVLCNSEISKAVLLETLTTEVGVNGGSRAQGQVHQDMHEFLKKKDAMAIKSTVRRDILRPMVEMTFGKGAPVPDIELCVKPEEDLDLIANRIAKLVKDTGLEIGQKYIRETMGIPEPEVGEEVVGGEPETEEPEGEESATSDQGDKNSKGA